MTKLRRSAMPMDYGVKGGVKATVRAATDMPDGVFPPTHVAQSVAADLTRARSRSWTGQRHAGVVVTISGEEVPEQELRERERLLAGARRGDPQAAAELWATRRAWVIAGPHRRGDEA